MTYVPAEASFVLPSETPKAGGTGKIDAAAAYVQEIAEDAGQFQTSVRGAQREFIGVTSKGVKKIDSKLGERLIPGAQTLQRSASSAKTAFHSYAAEVSRINGDADNVVTNIDDALGTIRTQSGLIEEIARKIRCSAEYTWNVVPPGAMPDPALDHRAKDMTAAEESAAVHTLRSLYEQQWLAAASSWNTALNTINAALRSWPTLIEERKTAETRLVQALEQTEIGQLISINGGPKQMPPFTIANTVSGELWGEDAVDLKLAKDHPLLKNLIGTASGEHVFDSPPNPDDVAANWSKLSDSDKERLINEVPWVIGNLPGLPFGVRDQANRKLLDYYVVHGDEMSATCNTALDEVLLAISKDDGEPPVSIVALNFESPVPKVAMGYGDLDVAKNVTWEVPGMLSDANAALPGWDTASKNVHAEQLRTLTATGGEGEGNAVVAFLEYDTPDLVTVLNANAAREGAKRFAAELDGTFATRGLNAALSNLAVIAHSYGTTTAANALTLVNHNVQSFTMLASAGLDGETVKRFADLHVDEDNSGVKKIYTTLADADGLAPFGSNASKRKQPNAGAADSLDLVIEGAYSFSSDGDGDLKATDSHDTINSKGQGYLDLGTQSIWNAAATSMGEIGKVRGPLAIVETPPPGSFVRSWLSVQAKQGSHS